jgi:hypothetical protein
MTGQLLAGPQGLFYLACALTLLAFAVIVVALKPVLGLWALAAVFATEDATPIPLDTSLLRTGSTHIYPADVLSVVLLLATVVFVIRRPPPARIMVPLSVAGTVFAVNLYRGVTQFGFHRATNESREWLYFLVTIAFVVAAGPWGPRFWRPWFGLAVLLTGLAWLGLARHGLHPVTSTITINGQQVDPRPLTAAGALGLAFALIALLGSPAIAPRRKAICGAVLVVTLVIVQQRTVWAVLAVTGLLWAAASLHQHSTAQHRRLTAMGGATLVAAALGLASGIAAGSAFGQSLAETTAKHSTLVWRLVGWSDLLHSDHSPAAIVWGLPFGSGYRRTILGTVTDVAPHSLYVATLLRLGLVGLIAMAVLYTNGWRHRRQAADALRVAPLTVPLLLVAMLVFSITYEPGYTAGAVIAGLLVWKAQPDREPAAEAVAGRPAPLMQGGP